MSIFNDWRERKIHSLQDKRAHGKVSVAWLETLIGAGDIRQLTAALLSQGIVVRVNCRPKTDACKEKMKVREHVWTTVDF